MNKTIIFGVIIIVLGAFIALGPIFLFKICDAADMTEDEVEITCCGPGGYPRCRWTAQAEIGIGLLIAALGACMMVFDEPKTQMSLAIGVFLAGLVALAVPHILIGGCPSSFDMACHQIAFPALNVESIVLLIFSAAIVIYIELKKPVVGKEMPA